MNDWIALIALNVTAVGLSSLAEKRTVIGIEYGKFLLDKYKLFGFLRVYYLLVGVAVINAAALVVMLHGACAPVLTTVVFFLLILSSWFVLYYLFAYVLRVHPAVKKAIYRKQLLGLYIKSDTECDFDGDKVIGMPPGDRTPKKITSDVQSFFNRFDEETIAAFHEVFSPTSLIYSRDAATMREWKRLGYGEPHDYHVLKRDKKKTPTEVVHISWEFFQMFRFSEIQDRWLLEILNIFNGSYADAYPRLRLYNVAAIFGQINRVGFAEGLYRYKFLDYMVPFIIRALDPKDDENRPERIPVERYFHEQFGQYIHDTMKYHPAATFTQSAKKALRAVICVEKYRGVIPVKGRIPCYIREDAVSSYNTLLREVVSEWEREAVQIKNLVFDFGNVLVEWNPDRLYGKKGEVFFASPSRYRKFRDQVLSAKWLRELDSQKDMHEIVEERCKDFPLFSEALRQYEKRWMETLGGQIPGMEELIGSLPDRIRILGLSNWCESTFVQARDKFPVLQRINEYMISGGLQDEDGNTIPSKPDPLIFKTFIKRFALNPEECLFVDDNYENVKAARRLGMKALWFIDAETLRLALEPILEEELKWGENRALWMAPDMMSGLEPGRVSIRDYDTTPFSFEDARLKEDFSRFETAEATRKMLDQPKCMLVKFGVEGGDAALGLSLSLRQAWWRHCQFVWHHRFDGQDNAERKQQDWRYKIVYGQLAGTEGEIRFPNSFCLHLVIETVEGNVLATAVSKKKTNDYPEVTAFTIGEQLEASDFQASEGNSSDFVTVWARRALHEEFGLSEAEIDKQFDLSSLRVLGLDMEEDIFNFSLVCTLKMRNKCEKFRRAIKMDTMEISGVSELPLSDVPSILLGYPDNKKKYHPSTYMRLLLFYLHKKGRAEARQALHGRV